MHSDRAKLSNSSPSFKLYEFARARTLELLLAPACQPGPQASGGLGGRRRLGAVGPEAAATCCRRARSRENAKADFIIAVLLVIAFSELATQKALATTAN